MFRCIDQRLHKVEACLKGTIFSMYMLKIAPKWTGVSLLPVVADDSLQSTCEGEKKEEKWLYKGIRT